MATLSFDATKIRPLLGSVTSLAVMGEASKVGRVVYVGTDDKMYQAAADNNVLGSGLLGVIVAYSSGKVDPTGVIAANDEVTVLWYGPFVAGGLTLDSTKQYFLANITSTVKGLIGDAAGAVSRRLGKPRQTDVFFFNPQDVATTSP